MGLSDSIPDISEIPGTRAAVIHEMLKFLEAKLPVAQLKEIRSLVEKLIEAAYKEGFEDGQWS